MEIHDGGIPRIAERGAVIVIVVDKRASGLKIHSEGMAISIKDTPEIRELPNFSFINEFRNGDIGRQFDVFPLIAFSFGKVIYEGIPVTLARNRVRVFQCTATREFSGISRKGSKGQQGREYDTYLFHLASSTFLPPRT